MTGKDKSDLATNQQSAEKAEKDEEARAGARGLVPGERSAVDDAT